MPVFRLHMRCICSVERLASDDVMSMATKSFPAPCNLEKRSSMMLVKEA